VQLRQYVEIMDADVSSSRKDTVAEEMELAAPANGRGRDKGEVGWPGFLDAASLSACFWPAGLPDRGQPATCSWIACYLFTDSLMPIEASLTPV